MTTSLRAPAALIAVYGLVALIGGTIGFVKAGSVASLIAGGGSGLILLVAAALVAKKQGVVAGLLQGGLGSSARAGLIIALVVSLLLIGRFASTLRNGASPIAIVMISGGLVVLVASAMALARARRP
jgi:uncharacterized membrane protein (UPF0136 family)